MTPADRLAAAPNVNALWAGLLVEELVRQGVGLFVVCPGSRSTPLAVAVARTAQEGRAEMLVHHDERAAAFVALGWGRATGRPAAVVTTSGTAVANLLPAAVEADAAGVPLLLLTADRPPELRETGANQTIRQPPIFRDVARWAVDLPPPTPDVDPAFVVSTAAHAVARSLSPPGPVHLNLPFREPLGPAPDGTDAATRLGALAGWLASSRPYANPTTAAELSDAQATALAVRLAEAERGIVVLGETPGPDGAGSAAALADRLGWPLVADAAAGRVSPGVVAHAEVILASDTFARAHRPGAVVLVGGRPVSKRLLAHMEAARPSLVVTIRSGPERFDPGHVVTDPLVADPAQACEAVAERVPNGRSDSRWRRAWSRASEAAAEALAAGLASGLSEPAVARRVAARADRLVVAASMPIRDMDTYAAPDERPRRVFANRGASGIDGTVATAHGVARGLGETTVVLIGDLALLHDQTSLMLLRSGPPVVVVVVNNDGGGIFHLLPVARGEHALDGETFERVMATPHGLTFEHAAAQVGLPYHAPTTTDAFEAALDAALASGASAVIEVHTDRREQAALRERIREAAARAVEEALGL